MLRKKRLKCGRIPARLFLACHQKSNTFKCKQFCCAKPMCAYLSVGCPPVPPDNAAPQHQARGSQSAARHIRTQTRRSLNGCMLVRLALQAVPSPSSVRFYHCGAAILALIIQFDMVLCFSSFIKTDFAEYIQKQTGSPRSAAIFAVYAG